ncbi:MAG: S1C family serine protease [Streptosporangiaceae bacterium]
MQDDETGTGSAGGDGGPAGGFDDAGQPQGASGPGKPQDATGEGEPQDATGEGEPQGATWPGKPQDVTGPEGTADGRPAVPGGYGAGAGPAQGDRRVSPRRRRGRIAVYALMAILAAGLGAAATVGLNSGHAAPATGVSSHRVPGPQNDAGSTGGGSLNKARVAAQVEPGVVDIDAAIEYSGGTSSEGTGMVISADGLVLTNNHVIDGSKSIRATLTSNGKVYQATVLGYDSSQDVALLQLNGASRLKPVLIGNSAQVTLGTPVLALGNAEGQGGTPAMAEGIINSLNKTISPTDESTGTTETLHDMLQTNADIVSGDSGGPLANSAGQVIGMDTANASNSPGPSSVLGFAIPIDAALSVAREIAAGQASATVQIGLPGFLGVLVPPGSNSSPQRQAQQQRKQIRQQQQSGGSGGAGGSNGNGNGPARPGTGCTNDDADTTVPSSVAPASSGALVDGVLCGTAASGAGLVSGDVITAVNRQAVTSPAALTAMMSASRPGRRVRLGWEGTGGQKKTTLVTLTAAPAR